jgi:hypothetical protein
MDNVYKFMPGRMARVVQMMVVENGLSLRTVGEGSGSGCLVGKLTIPIEALALYASS